MHDVFMKLRVTTTYGYMMSMCRNLLWISVVFSNRAKFNGLGWGFFFVVVCLFLSRKDPSQVLLGSSGTLGQGLQC